MKTLNDFAFQFATSKHYRSTWQNLDCCQYPCQPIKLVNLVVLSPCETEPFNKFSYDYVSTNHNYVISKA